MILALGARFADETTCSYRKGVSFNFPDTKLIHIDIDAGEIGKNYGADIGILGDLKDALEKLNSGFGEFEVNKEYLEEIKALREKWFDYLKISEVKNQSISPFLSLSESSMRFFPRILL